MAQGGRAFGGLPDGRVICRRASPETARCGFLRERTSAEGAAVEISAPNAESRSPAVPFYGALRRLFLQHASLKFQEQSARSRPRGRIRERGTSGVLQNAFREPFGYALPRVRAGTPGASGSEGSHSVTPSGCVAPCSARAGWDVLARGADQFPRVQELSARLITRRGPRLLFYKGIYFAAEFPRKNRREQSPSRRKTLSMDASVFFQSDLGLLPELVRTVRAARPARENFIDLSWRQVLPPRSSEDHFEPSHRGTRRGCLRHARRNLFPRGRKSGRSKIWLAEHDAPVPRTMLIVDPPRTGILPEPRRALQNGHPGVFCMFPCDPVTLAQDFASSKKGHGIRDAHGFGFYPQTPHFENVSGTFAKTDACL